MAYEECPGCGTEKHQLVRCPQCGFQRHATGLKKRPSIVDVERFIEGRLEKSGGDDINAVAIVGSPAPGPIMGLIFEINGKWIYANDYLLSDDDLVEVSPDDSIVIVWKRQ